MPNQVARMPQPIPSESSGQLPPAATSVAYPAQTKQITAVIDGIETETSCTYFSDKIVVTISQEGRLAQWVSMLTPVQLPLELTLCVDPRTLGSEQSFFIRTAHLTGHWRRRDASTNTLLNPEDASRRIYY